MATPQKVQEKSSGCLDPNWVRHVRNSCGTGETPPVYIAEQAQEEKKEEVKN